MKNNYIFFVNQSQLRLDQYLVSKLPDISRSKIQNYIKLGYITVNGEPVKASLILQGTEIVECKLKIESDYIKVIPEKMNLNILRWL